VLQQALTLRTAAPEYNPLMVYRVLASLYSDAGDLRSAIGFLKQVQERDPGYSLANNVDGDIQILEGRGRPERPGPEGTPAVGLPH